MVGHESSVLISAGIVVSSVVSLSANWESQVLTLCLLMCAVDDECNRSFAFAFGRLKMKRDQLSTIQAPQGSV